jgi:hypothetical protein
MAAAALNTVRRVDANRVKVTLTPSTSYPTGGEPIGTLLRALTIDGVRPIQGIVHIGSQTARSGVLGAHWVWDGADKMLAFCLVTGVQAASTLDVSTAIVDLVVTFI